MYSRGKFIIRNIISAITSIIIVVLTFLTIFNVAFNIIYKKYDVWGYSMQPTLNADVEGRNVDGDIVYINLFADAKVNDVVVANVKWNENSVIKRLVGTPGDTVKIALDENGFYLYCNEKLLYTRPAEFETISYFSKTTNYINKFENSYFDSDNNFCVELKDNEYFLMGDHWTGSMLDSLTSGPVKKSEIAGRVDIVIKQKEKHKIQSLAKSLLGLIFKERVSL